MNIINTTAPISIDDLKKYFVDKDIKFVIDYKESKLKETKLLVYLSNLDVPCDIEIDTESEEFFSLLSHYLNFHMIINIEILERYALAMILCYMGIIEEPKFSSFIDKNKDILERWKSVLNSLALYNISTITIPEIQEQISKFETIEDDSLVGINFVNLLKYEDMYMIFSNYDKNDLKYYQTFFKDCVYRGNNLYKYWANENNPMFLTTWAALDTNIDVDHYAKMAIDLENQQATSTQ